MLDPAYSARHSPETLRLAVEATTAWRPTDLDAVLHVTAARVGVLSDVHCPLHSAPWLLQAVRTFIHFGVKHIIINGDFIDANQISKHAGSYFRRGTLEDDLKSAESVLALLSAHFDHLYLDAGNHDMRIIHRMGGEISYQRAAKLFGDHPKLQVTSRSFCRVNDSVVVLHPRQYSRLRGGLAQRLSMRHQCSTLTGHQHHSAMTISPDGKWQSCDVGTLADVERQDYIKNEFSDHVEPVNGFAIIFGEKIQCFDKFTPWELYGLEAGEGL